jgi:hypothetical protein
MLKSIRFAALPVLGLMGALAAGASPAHAFDRHVVLTNNTHHTIISFYASNVTRPTWEEDILGSRVLPPGRSVNIDLTDGSGQCRFDFKTVLDNNTGVVSRNVDVCSVSTYTVNE